MPWLMFAVGFAFFRLTGRLVHWTPQVIGALILTGSLANTSFVGLPMIEAYYGNQNGEVAVGLLIDQSFLTLTTWYYALGQCNAGSAVPSNRWRPEN